MEETTPTTPEKKSNMNMIIIVGAVVIVLIGGFMLLNRSAGQTQEEMSPSPTETMVEPTTATGSGESTDMGTGTPGATDVVNVDMEAGAYYYTPKTITVKKGQTVHINLTAKDMMHNFNIDELNVKSDTVKAGSSTTIEFVADKVGSFEYYCLVGNHRKMGQVGTLTVTE